MTTTDSPEMVQTEGTETSFAHWCGELADVAVAASVCLVPLCLGGRIALGQVLLLACAVIAALGWSGTLVFGRKTTWISTGTEPLLVGVLVLGLLQLTPFPGELLSWLSPQHGKLLPMWSAGAEVAGSFGSWRTLSLSVGETESALIVGLSYVLLFSVAMQRIRRVSDVERLLKTVAISVSAMAVFGVVQWLSNNGKFFWFYDYPLTSPEHRMKGAFTNRNHFAQFLALGCAPLLWWILRVLDKRTSAQASFGSRGSSKSDSDTALGGLLLVLGVLVFAVLFSLSRGGMIALGVSLFVMLIALFWIGALSGRVLGSLLGISAIAGCLFVMLGHEKVGERLDNWQSDSRLAIWQANVQVINHFPLFGTGLGSHSEAYPLFYDPPFAETEFTHAENSYLQVASECGLCGLLLAGISVTYCAVWCWRGLRTRNSVRERMLAAAISASLAANFVHALVDFVWFVPGLMTTVLVLAACARRLDQLSAATGVVSVSGIARATGVRVENSSPTPRVLPRGLGLITAVATLAVGCWSCPPLLHATLAEPHWFDYLRLTLRSPEAREDSANQDETESPTAETDGIDDEAEADPIARFKQRVASLSHVTKLNPDHVRAHVRLSALYLSAFDELQKNSENPMSLAQLRDAALASPFESVAAMREWLQRAVGPNLKYLDAAADHARQAVRLCPLQAAAYVSLADLAFLEDRNTARSTELLHQALLVRPHSAQVRFVVGREAMLEGRVDDAVNAWKGAFHQQRIYQDRILDLLVGNVPPQVILDDFDPELDVLQKLEVRYRQLPAQYPVIARAYADSLRIDAARPDCDRPIDRLVSAAGVFARLNRPTETELCFRRALEIDTHSVAVRRSYGNFLIEQGQFTRAAEQLQAGVRLAPGDDSLRRMAELAAKRSMQSDSRIQPIEFRRKRSLTRSASEGERSVNR